MCLCALGGGKKKDFRQPLVGPHQPCFMRHPIREAATGCFIIPEGALRTTMSLLRFSENL